MKHKLPDLNYGYDSLEPFIDAKTMEIHYSKHHQAYVDKLNVALEGHKELLDKPLIELIIELDKVSEEIRQTVRNNGGGHLNHSFFWQILKKDVKIKGKILEAIIKKFGSLDKFKESFKSASMNHFGSGWAWLVYVNGDLEIITTSNQDNPLSTGKIPLLAIDLWEHAYYLKYQNRRADYVDAFFYVINWQQVESNFIEAVKHLINQKYTRYKLEPKRVGK
ncbi:superoxide dismutase [Candidatus Pacearchaeota archaeon]|nr:superoxide dismutase [Candidatus Pacearchaeota archaeon]